MPDEPKFNQEQYDLLMECSKKRDMSKWNDFVETTDEKICLAGVDLSGKQIKERRYLVGADFSEAILREANLSKTELSDANFSNADLSNTNLSWTYVSNSKFTQANLRNANFYRADLDQASLVMADLRKADLRKANLHDANLVEIDLSGADLRESNLRWADLRGADLNGADLRKSDLKNADLQDADLSRVDFRGSDLNKADLTETKLIEANMDDAILRKTRLISANLTGASITGGYLYGSTRDDWKIDGIKCDYVYWDKNGDLRTPENRNFKSGEFEELYKSLPEIKHYFSEDFTPITHLIMEKVVNSINQKHPEFNLTLESFDSRDQPHAVFRILHTEYKEEASQAIQNEYKETNLKLEGQVEILKELLSGTIERPQLIQQANQIINNPKRIDNMGDTFNATSGRDTIIGTGNATMTVENTEISIVRNDFESLAAALGKHKVSQEDIDQLKDAVTDDKDALEHQDKSFGKNVGQWFSNMCMKAGSTAWRISEGAAAGLLGNALKAYYGWG